MAVEMVERVAQAIEQALFDGTDAARAAIEALREPTPAMLDASWQATVRTDPSHVMAVLLATPEAAHKHKTLKRHRAMIDAALGS